MAFVIVLDTETTNTLEEPIAYDIGWAVVNLEMEEVVKTESYAVAEVFLDKEWMAAAYFAEKVPSYWEEIKHGDRKLARLYTIRKSLLVDCRTYGVKEIYAHNAYFDYCSTAFTIRYLTGSKRRYFLPYGIKICDTLKMARQAFGKNEDYRAFCEENGYKTARNQVRLTAEILYRYMSGDNDFEEVHKGVDDVLIEKEILFECLRRGIEDGALWAKE